MGDRGNHDYPQWCLIWEVASTMIILSGACYGRLRQPWLSSVVPDMGGRVNHDYPQWCLIWEVASTMIILSGAWYGRSRQPWLSSEVPDMGGCINHEWCLIWEVASTMIILSDAWYGRSCQPWLSSVVPDMGGRVNHDDYKKTVWPSFVCLLLNVLTCVFVGVLSTCRTRRLRIYYYSSYLQYRTGVWNTCTQNHRMIGEILNSEGMIECGILPAVCTSWCVLKFPTYIYIYIYIHIYIYIYIYIFFMKNG